MAPKPQVLKTDLLAIDKLAKRINVPSDWILALFYTEGGMRPQAKNMGLDKRGVSAKMVADNNRKLIAKGQKPMPPEMIGQPLAVGLNQMYYTNVWAFYGMLPTQLLAKYPTAGAQLSEGGPAYRYFTTGGAAAPYSGLAEFGMANFLPSMRKAGLDTPLPSYVVKANPHLTTPRAYLKALISSINKLPSNYRYAARRVAGDALA